MSGLQLVIGNKTYSSWSLRPWLLLTQCGIPFSEIRIALYQAQGKVQARQYSPAGKVPVLLDGALRVWDSLAICEYLAERFPEQRLWPADPAARALARSISAEMHSGFTALREHMTMNCRKILPGKGRAAGVQDDIERIQEIWRDCRSRYGADGPFLFGQFSIADAMYAPVVTRFVTYVVALDPLSQAYVDHIWALPALQSWVAQAREETEVVEMYER